jgi:CheY-like chemotaxis protein
MPQGGHLTIETADAELDEAFARRNPGARPGSHVMVGVVDTGIGMDAATQAHLFEPFFTTKGPGKGTGLGLATVYGIVKQHDGYIAVDSEAGRGSTFRIFLPRVTEPLATVDAGAPAPQPGAASETILLVEDEAGLRDLVREILEAHGYRVLQARRPDEAIRISAEHTGPVHLMVTDVVMPQMSGRETADRLSAQRPGLRVLYMSGYTDDAIVHHGVLDPGTDFLPKPFTPDTLVRKVREVLDRAAPRRSA